MLLTARLIGRSACALALCAMVVFAMQSRSHEAAVDHWSPSYFVEASDDPDADEMMLSEIPVILLPNRSGPDVKHDWMQLETDPCGRLQHIHNGGSLVWQSAIADDPSDSGEEDDPSDQGRELIAQWLSDHSELAVINDEIDKSCDETFDDEPVVPDLAVA